MQTIEEHDQRKWLFYDEEPDSFTGGMKSGTIDAWCSEFAAALAYRIKAGINKTQDQPDDIYCL